MHKTVFHRVRLKNIKVEITVRLVLHMYSIHSMKVCYASILINVAVYTDWIIACLQSKLTATQSIFWYLRLFSSHLSTWQHQCCIELWVLPNHFWVHISTGAKCFQCEQGRWTKIVYQFRWKPAHCWLSVHSLPTLMCFGFKLFARRI